MTEIEAQSAAMRQLKVSEAYYKPIVEKLESRIAQLEAERDEADTVPRSRYDVACDQYNEAEAKRKDQFAKAQDAYARMEAAERVSQRTLADYTTVLAERINAEAARDRLASENGALRVELDKAGRLLSGPVMHGDGVLPCGGHGACAICIIVERIKALTALPRGDAAQEGAGK